MLHSGLYLLVFRTFVFINFFQYNQWQNLVVKTPYKATMYRKEICYLSPQRGHFLLF